MNTYQNASLYFRERLSGVYDHAEILTICDWLLEAYTGKKSMTFRLDPLQEIPSEVQNKLKVAVGRLERNEPVQYILGQTGFMGLELEVNRQVLIPRPETEELANWIIKEHRSDNKMIICDIGTGSGCIALALAHHLPQSTVWALDKSAEALEVAKRNAGRHGIQTEFIQADIFEAPLPQEFTLIVSNPPYVRHCEKEAMAGNVLDYEPHTALFVPDSEPLLFYRRICELSFHGLKNEGWLYFEINENLGEEMRLLMQSFDFQHIEIRKDMQNKNRMIRGQKP